MFHICIIKKKQKTKQILHYQLNPYPFTLQHVMFKNKTHFTKRKNFWKLQRNGRMTEWRFTFKPQSWQRKFSSCLSFSEHVQVLSLMSKLETHNRTELAGCWLAGQKYNYRWKEMDSQHRFVITRDCCGSFWFILSRIPPGLLAKKKRDRKAGCIKAKRREKWVQPTLAALKLVPSKLL